MYVGTGCFGILFPVIICSLIIFDWYVLASWMETGNWRWRGRCQNGWVISFWIKWPNTLPCNLCILKCHHHFFYCYFTPLLFSCWNTPLFLLLKYSPILAVTDLCLHNTPPGYFICYLTFTKSKTIFKHVPQLLRSYWIFSPIPPIYIGILNHIPSS